MGAWALGLHDSDFDRDLINDLDVKCGLDDLTFEAQKKIIDKHIDAHLPFGTHNAGELLYSLLAGDNSEYNKIARDFLESTGAIAKLIQDTKAKPASMDDCFDPRYVLVHIGLCAMSHGLVLDEDFLEYMRENFTETEFQRDALKQIDTVCCTGLPS